MTVHLIKLSVGPETLSDLAKWQSQRLLEMKRKGHKPELMHITRHMPKRSEEILDGGSIFWVIKGFVCARQKLIELRPVLCDGISHCGLVLDKKLVQVKLRPHRPFQGWRYLNAREAPPDLAKPKKGNEMPEEMLRELAECGLL